MLPATSVKLDGSPTDRAALVFRRWLTRPPTDDERSAIVAYFERQLARLERGELNPAAVTGDKMASAELAAWAMAARAIMNLDETVTKE